MISDRRSFLGKKRTGSMQPLVRKLYKRLLLAGRDYPTGLADVRDKVKEEFFKNKDVSGKLLVLRAKKTLLLRRVPLYILSERNRNRSVVTEPRCFRRRRAEASVGLWRAPSRLFPHGIPFGIPLKFKSGRDECRGEDDRYLKRRARSVALRNTLDRPNRTGNETEIRLKNEAQIDTANWTLTVCGNTGFRTRGKSRDQQAARSLRSLPRYASMKVADETQPRINDSKCWGGAYDRAVTRGVCVCVCVCVCPNGLPLCVKMIKETLSRAVHAG